MNIWTPPGHKIKLTNPNAAWPGQIKAAKKHLKEGGVYTIDKIEVNSTNTVVELVGVENVRFSSCQFENVDAVDPVVLKAREKVWLKKRTKRNKK